MARSNAFDKKQQHQAKRQAIINEAAKAFNEYGYEGTSLDTIASRLGVTKKALYYYVKNKQEILYEIICQWQNTQSTALEYANENGGSGLEKLRLYAEKYVASVLQDLTPVDRMIGELSSLDEERLSKVLQGRKTNDRQLLAFVRQAQSEGAATGLEPKMVVHTLNGALDWIFKWYKEGGELNAPQAALAVFEVISQGLEHGQRA